MLPAPESELYATGPASPHDGVVAAFMAGRPWAEGLAGAAGALAVADGALDLVAARWAAYRAGYPFPITEMAEERCAPGTQPKELGGVVEAWLAKGRAVGVARARAGLEDRWVVLAGREGPVLPPFERHHPLGTRFELSGEGFDHWLLVSPSGLLFTGDPPVRAALDEDGEWWLELRQGEHAVVAVPLSAGQSTPLVPWVDSSVPDEGDPFPALLGAVDKLRQDFDAGVLELDPMLGTLSSEPFERLLAGRFDSSWADERLAGAGFRGPHGVLACSEARLALCVDGWMRRAESRALLLDPTVTLAGGQAAHAGDRVVAVLALAEP